MSVICRCKVKQLKNILHVLYMGQKYEYVCTKCNKLVLNKKNDNEKV